MREALAAKNGKKKAGHLFHPCCLCSLVFLGLRRSAASCLQKNNFKTCMGAGKLAQNQNPACEEAMGLGGVGGLGK